MILRNTACRPGTYCLQALQETFGDRYAYSWNGFRHETDWGRRVVGESIKQERPLLCAETPVLGRSAFDTASDPPGPGCYFRLAFSCVSTFHGANYCLPAQAEPRRLEQILARTNTIMRDWRTDGEHLLYCLQVPGDTSLLGLNVYHAAQYDLTMLRRITDRPIKVCLHPAHRYRWETSDFRDEPKNGYEGFLRVLEMLGLDLASEPTLSLLQGAWCVVCHSSGIACDAVTAGIPAITLSEHSFLRPVTGHSWYDVLDPPTPDRLPWLSRLAYSQWNLDEIRNGSFASHLDRFPPFTYCR